VTLLRRAPFLHALWRIDRRIFFRPVYRRWYLSSVSSSISSSCKNTLLSLHLRLFGISEPPVPGTLGVFFAKQQCYVFSLTGAVLSPPSCEHCQSCSPCRLRFSDSELFDTFANLIMPFSHPEPVFSVRSSPHPSEDEELSPDQDEHGVLEDGPATPPLLWFQTKVQSLPFRAALPLAVFFSSPAAFPSFQHLARPFHAEAGLCRAFESCQRAPHEQTVFSFHELSVPPQHVGREVVSLGCVPFLRRLSLR